MSVDGPARLAIEPGAKLSTADTGFLAGSKALDSLARFITSKELMFHPSQNAAVTRTVCRDSHFYSVR